MLRDMSLVLRQRARPARFHVVVSVVSKPSFDNDGFVQNDLRQQQLTDYITRRRTFENFPQYLSSVLWQIVVYINFFPIFVDDELLI